MTLALSLIVKDETWQLKRLLESIKGIPFDEKVIVLTSDSEETKRIAEEFGCKTFNFKWVNNYSAARNYSLSQCKTDYVAWFDADDEVENPHLLMELLGDMIKKGATNLRLPYLYKKEDGSVFMTIFRERIIKNGSYKWTGALHETLETRLNETPLFSDTVKVIHHWDENKGRYSRNLIISESSYKENKCLVTAFAYSMSLADMEKQGEALEIIKNYPLVDVHPQYHYFVLIFKGELALHLKLYDDAITYFKEANVLFPELGEPLFRMAEVFHFQKEYEKVFKYCSKGFYLNEPYHWIMPVKHENYRLRPAKIYAYALNKLGQQKMALAVVSETINSYQDDTWLQKFRREVTKDLLIQEVLDERNKTDILQNTTR